MSLKEIIAKLAGLEQRVEGALKQEVASIQATVNGMLASAQAKVEELTKTVASLETGKADAEAKVTELTEKLSAANKLELDLRGALLKHLSALPGHADYKEGGAKANAPLTELIVAEQNATNAAIAATGVKVDQLPAGGLAPEAAKKPVNLTEACLKANKKA